MRIPKILANRYTSLWILGLLTNATLWWAWSQFPQGSAPLVLRYVIGGGIDVLGERSLLATIPAMGALILLINGAMTAFLHRRDSLLATLSGIVAVGIQLILLVALLLLLSENLG